MNGISQHEKLIFLLGGHDLEMVEIRNILDQKGLKYFDFNLEWGAQLSRYLPVFDGEHTFVGIELTNDCPQPANYIEIDHHNEKSHLPASIEQIGNLLGIELNYYQLLVAANDRGYIPAMQALGACSKEIKEIREKDRRAQGVTLDEELQAQYESEKNFKYEKDIGIVKTTLSRFSSLADKLYVPNSKMIIYNENSVNYYGKSAGIKVKELFKDELTARYAYSGGGDDGFWGINIKKSKYKETKEVVDMIIKEVGEQPKVSVHYFLFPFGWHNQIPKDKGKSQNNIIKGKDEKIFDKINESLLSAGWQRHNDYNIAASNLNYNEFTYYHEFVREVIFDTPEENERDVMRYYRFKELKSEAYVKIEARPFSHKEYKLRLTGLHLHLYKTGVGVLGFDLENYEPSTTSDDILAINEYGRRMYPQFLGENFDIHPTREAFLASKITFSLDGNEESEIVEDFSDYMKVAERLTTLKSYIPPKYISCLFQGFAFCDENNDKSENNRIIIDRLTDDRMFTISWFGNNELANELGKPIKNGYKYEESDLWYCYLYGDKKWPSIANKYLKKKQIQDFTYSRWAEHGTLFGITRDTFVAVSSDIPTLKRVNSPSICDHVSTIYYQMVVLCLVQRATILKFAGDVSSLSDIENSESDKELIQRVTKLYSNYIEFINKIYFREVTSQIQGIELYQLAQQVMNIEKEATKLDEEISELHTYASFVQDKQRNEQSHKLNMLAAWFLPATFIATILGIGFISETSRFHWFAWPTSEVMTSLFLIIAGGGIASFCTISWLKYSTFKNRNNKKTKKTSKK